MSERPKKATSATAPVEDPPRKPDDADEQEDAGGTQSSRPGRRTRTRPSSGSKDTAASGTFVEAPGTFDAESVTQAWDKFRSADEVVNLLVKRANAINSEVEDAWNAGGFDKNAVKKEILRFDDVRDRQGLLALDAVKQASVLFRSEASEENAQAYAVVVEDFATKVHMLEEAGKDFLAAVERAPKIVSDDPQMPGDADPEQQPGVRKPKNMDEYLEMTRSEKIQKLSEKLEGFKRPAEDKYLSRALYDRRVTNFAERTGLTAERDALAAKEAAYYVARKRSYRTGRVDKKELQALKKAYTDSLFAWNTALSGKAEGLDQKSRIEALAIRKRDTILRPKSLEIDARREGMSEKEWNDIGKYVNRDIVENVAKVASVPAGFLGRGIAMLHKSARGESQSAKLQREILGKKYGRAAMIIGGAAAATMIAVSATPVTATAGALTLGVFLGRGVIGTVAGSLGGRASGGIYQKVFGNKKREHLGIAGSMKKEFATQQEYEAFLKEFGKNNAQARGKEKARWQIAGSLVAGGTVGLATSPIAHFALDQIGALPSVQHAADTVARVDSGDTAFDPPKPAESAAVNPDAAPAAADVVVTPTAPEGPFVQEAVIGKGEGFNQLFVDIRNSDFAGTTAVGKMLLNGEFSVTELSERIGALDPKTGSAVMEVGDKLVLDSNENLWFIREGSEPQLLMENSSAAPEGVAVNELKNVSMAKPFVPVVEASQAAATGSPHPEASVPASEVPNQASGPVVEDQRSETVDTLEEGTVIPEAQRTIEDSVREAQQGTPPTTGENNPPSQQSADEGARTIEESIREAGLAGTEGLVNSHGVEVNPAVSATYDWKLPGVDESYTVVFGGSAEEIARAVQAEMRLDPTARVLVNTPVVDAQTGELTIRVDEWRMGEQGEPQLLEGIKDAAGRNLPPITAENLIRKLR